MEYNRESLFCNDTGIGPWEENNEDMKYFFDDSLQKQLYPELQSSLTINNKNKTKLTKIIYQKELNKGSAKKEQQKVQTSLHQLSNISQKRRKVHISHTLQSILKEEVQSDSFQHQTITLGHESRSIFPEIPSKEQTSKVQIHKQNEQNKLGNQNLLPYISNCNLSRRKESLFAHNSKRRDKQIEIGEKKFNNFQKLFNFQKTTKLHLKTQQPVTQTPKNHLEQLTATNKYIILLTLEQEKNKFDLIKQYRK